MTMTEPQRLRFTFAKHGPMRFTGHLDLHHACERTLRRANAPVAHSAGFSPRPRLSLGLALPLGFTSDCELIDVWLAEPRQPAQLLPALQLSAPPGLRVLAALAVDAKEPALQKQIVAASYEAHLQQASSLADLHRRIRLLLDSPEILRQWRGKSYDLRPLIETLEARPTDDGGVLLLMRLSAVEGATGRPEEVLQSLDLDPHGAHIHRVQIHLK